MDPRPSRPIADLATHTLLTRLAAIGLGLASAVVMARAVGPDGRGRIALVAALVLLGQYVSSQALSHGQFRLWSRHAAPEAVLIRAGAWLSLLAAVVSGVFAWIVYAIGRDSFLAAVQPLDLALLVAALPVWIHLILVRDVLIMRGRIKDANLAVLAGATVRVAGIVGLAAIGRLGVDTALAMVVAGQAVPWALMCIMLRLGRRQLLAPTPVGVMRQEAAVGAELAPAFLFQQLNLRLDVLFVAQFAGVEVVGVYAVAVLLSELAWVAANALTYTVRERQANADAASAADITAKSVRVNLLMAGGIALAIAAVAPLLIAPLLGDEFAPAAPVVWALVPGAAAMPAWRGLTTALVRFVRPWVVPVVALGAVTLGVGLCWWWVQEWGAVGAGLACSAGYVAGMLASAAVFCHATRLPAGALVPGVADVARLIAAARGGRRRVQTALARS